MSKNQADDDNYTTNIPAHLLDAIMLYPFTKQQLKVLLLIIRKTYGFGKKTDDIAFSVYEKLTGIARTHVSLTLKQLEEDNVITKERAKYGFKVGVKKNFKKWRRWSDDWEVKENIIQPVDIEPDMTDEERHCYEGFAKSHQHWGARCTSVKEFLRLYNMNTPNGLKIQYQEAKLKSEQRLNGYESRNKSYSERRQSVSEALSGRNGTAAERIAARLARSNQQDGIVISGVFSDVSG
jgi:phage replication O-like protein O